LSGQRGIDFATTVAKEIEYHWNDNKDDDAFEAD